MSQDLLARKWEREFRNIDTDGNGVIEQSDMDLIVQTWCLDFGVRPGSEKWKRITDLNHLMWRRLIGTEDEDGFKRVGLADWIATHRQPDFIEKVVIPIGDMAVELADHDDDGRLSRQDWLVGQRTTGQSDEEILEAFDILDTDKDGYVTKEECFVALRQFYTSTDAADLGNQIAGRL